jgi:hypothetical protein
MEGLGFRFWAWLAGCVVLGGIVLMVLFLIFYRAVYAWGLIGAFLFVALVLLLIGWIYDRRHERYETE